MKTKCCYHDSFGNERIIKLKGYSFKTMQREFKELSKRQLYELSYHVEDMLFIQSCHNSLIRTVDLHIRYHYKYKRVIAVIRLLDGKETKHYIEKLFIHRNRKIARKQVQQNIYEQTGILVNPNILNAVDGYIILYELDNDKYKNSVQTKSARNI